jgi:hypothetical protein
MPNNINSASRLVAILKSIPSQNPNRQPIEVWSDLFMIQDVNPHRKTILVGERLSAMHREIELVQEQMRKANFSDHLYGAAVSHIENALSAMLLATQWSQVLQYLTPETFVALSFCGEILPDEESIIEPNELTSIAAQVQELEDSLAASTLPPRLLALMRHHIDLIRRALAEYPIAGAKALREAARIALGEIIEIKETVTANREAPELGKLGAVWKHVNGAADIALKADKVSQIGQKAWEMIGGFF